MIGALCAELADGLAVRDQGDRAALLVDELGLRIDGEAVVEGRDDVADADGVFGGLVGVRVGDADSLAHLQSPAGDHRGHDTGPVIPPRRAVDAWGPSELA